MGQRKSRPPQPRSRPECGREKGKRRRAGGRPNEETLILTNDRDAIICLEGKIVPYVIFLQKLHAFTIPWLDNSRSDCYTAWTHWRRCRTKVAAWLKCCDLCWGKDQRMIKDRSSFLQLEFRSDTSTQTVAVVGLLLLFSLASLGRVHWLVASIEQNVNMQNIFAERPPVDRGCVFLPVDKNAY